MPSFHAAPIADAVLATRTDARPDVRSRHPTIVLLGIDGAGKTTAATTLVEGIRATGAWAQLLRNPAGRRWMSRVAVRFDTVLPPLWAHRTESVVRSLNVLLAHARAAVFPGVTVMDRHLACQLVLSSVRGLPHGRLLPWLIARLPKPDLVILVDVPAEVAHARIVARGEDSETLAYLASARATYLELAKAKGWHVLDGTGTPERVSRNVLLAVSRTD